MGIICNKGQIMRIIFILIKKKKKLMDFTLNFQLVQSSSLVRLDTIKPEVLQSSDRKVPSCLSVSQ
jgi:hypothetical protein